MKRKVIRERETEKVTVNVTKPDEHLKLYYISHKVYGTTTINARSKYEAVLAASKLWAVRWTTIAKEADIRLLAVDKEGLE